MKKLLALILAAALTLSLVACGGGSEPQSTDAAPSETMQVDKGLLSVEVTMPAGFFEDETEEEIKAAAEEAGYSRCEINADGSVTYTMTKAQHAEALSEMAEDFDAAISGYLEGENEVASFVDIQRDQDFSRFDIYVDPAAYSDWDLLSVLGFYAVGVYYQSFSGVDDEDIEIVVNFIDNDSQELMETASYQEALQSMEADDSAAES